MANFLLTNIFPRKIITQNVIFRNLYMSKYVQQRKHVHNIYYQAKDVEKRVLFRGLNYALLPTKLIYGY